MDTKVIDIKRVNDEVTKAYNEFKRDELAQLGKVVFLMCGLYVLVLTELKFILSVSKYITSQF